MIVVIFINLEPNTDLDTVGGGYCVFAEVANAASLATVDAVATAVKEQGQTPTIQRIVLLQGELRPS